MRTLKITILTIVTVLGLFNTAYAAPIYRNERSILPETTNTYYLGSTSPNRAWNGIYTKDLTVSGTCTGCGGGSASDKWATSTTDSTAIYPNSALKVGIGTTTPGAALGINGNILFTREATRRITVGDSVTTDAAGGALSISAGTANGAGAGGALNLTAGSADPSSGSNPNGGSVNITAGNSRGVGTMGSINLVAGTTINAAVSGGNINLTAGANTGSIALTVGSGISATNGINGGTFTLSGGAGGLANASGGNAGAFTITGGAGGDSNGGFGSQTTVSGGNGSSVSIRAGAGGSASGATVTNTGGNGGSLTFQTGAAGSGTTVNGSIGTMSFNIGGANTKMTIDTTGNVGIGTTSPSQTLSVGGSLFVGASTAGGTVGGFGVGSVNNIANTIEANSTTYPLSIGGNGPNLASNARYNSGWKYMVNGPAEAWGLLNIAGDFGVFMAPSGTAGNAVTWTTPFAVLNTGNVGIGSTTPWGQLSVNPNALGSGVPEFVIGSSTATHFLINGAGNVGIGTTTPSSTLDIYGSLSTRVRHITSTTTLDSTYQTVTVNTVSNAVGVNLPALATVCGRIYDVSKRNAAGFDLTIDASGTETINGSLTQTITTQYTNYTLQASCSPGAVEWIIK